MSVMRECSLHIGMRVHSTILASAVGVPIIGMVYAPKVRGLLNLVGTEEYALELNELNSERLEDVLVEAFNSRDEITRRQQAVVSRLKDGAKRSGALLKEKFLQNTPPRVNEEASVKTA